MGVNSCWRGRRPGRVEMRKDEVTEATGQVTPSLVGARSLDFILTATTLEGVYKAVHFPFTLLQTKYKTLY